MENKNKTTNDSIKIISDNMEKIKNLNDWDNKVSLIKETRELVKKQKYKLSKLKNDISNFDEDEDIDFGKMDLSKIINKINKTKNLEKKIQNLKLLKIWIKQQKNKVIGKNES